MSDTNELPLEHCSEYDSAAEWCAKRGFKGTVGDPLPCNMETNGALKYIQADPEAFERRVREFAYGLSFRDEEQTQGSFNHTV